MRFTVLSALVLVVSVMVTTGCQTPLAKDTPRPFPHDTVPPKQEPTSGFRDDLVPLRHVDHRGKLPAKTFATYAQCQIDLPVEHAGNAGLFGIPEDNAAKIRACVAAAEKERVNLLILPELALAFGEKTRLELTEEIKKTARENDMIIIAGTYYDSLRHNRYVVIGPDWYEEGYKIHPSRYEVSPLYGLGMRPGPELLLIDTPYGRILPIVCVDMISDGVQYQARNLANRGLVDVIANLNYNPASWEFLVEANSMARRHAVFVTVTNIAAWSPTKDVCLKKGDNGFCGGNTALFGNLHSDPGGCPNCVQSLIPRLPSCFLSSGKRSVPYDSLVADIPPHTEALLVYDLNLRLLREPENTNAPDQGYPTIRNVRIIPLELKKALASTRQSIMVYK